MAQTTREKVPFALTLFRFQGKNHHCVRRFQLGSYQKAYRVNVNEQCINRSTLAPFQRSMAEPSTSISYLFSNEHHKIVVLFCGVLQSSSGLDSVVLSQLRRGKLTLG